MQQFTNLIELEEMARANLEPGAFGYIAGGADDEVTLRRNREDWGRITLRPRYLMDVSNIDCSTTVLGTPVSMPILAAPTAGHKLCCDQGELATAQAVADAGTIMILSTLASTSLEEVAAVAPAAPRWFQLYVYRDREVTKWLVERAHAAGYRALCLTIDTPFIGNRERDLKNNFVLPFPMANFAGRDMQNLPTGVVDDETSSLGKYISSKWDPALVWDDVAWLASIAPMPVLVKGVLTAEDARLAVEYGASGIVVSNHGGRQLDGVDSGAAALPEVVEAVAGRIEVLVDGGIRRGTDVLKALAMGASAVCIGRPYLYGLAIGGKEGATRVLELLRRELQNAMALTGRPTIESIDAGLIKR